MNIGSVIALVWKERGVATDLVNQMKGLNSDTGWKSSSFIAALIGKVALAWGALKGIIPGNVWAWGTAAIACTYILSRGAYKIFEIIVALKAGNMALGDTLLDATSTGTVQELDVAATVKK